MKKLMLMLFLLLFGAFNVSAQTQAEKALDKLLGTGLIGELQGFRQSMLTTLRTLKKDKTQSEKSLLKVKLAYETVENEYNTILRKIETDLLDKEKRKFILKYPEDYMGAWDAKFRAMKDKSLYDLQYAIADANNHGSIKTGSAGIILLIPTLIQVANETIKIIREIQAEMKQFTQEMLDTQFYQPLHLPAWEEI